VSDSLGQFKIFLGMAAGVGKTYRMLQEGRAEAETGRDVVIGYLETHGRAETLAQARGLEQVARREIAYRGSLLSEMDLPAILRRAPELCLIDELAHSNAPGLEHTKRHHDVADVLAAGIDVYSTVNVQHLESLNDQVAELTGTRVRETLPDSVLASADGVVLIDITPDSLRERLAAGKIYPSERISRALSSFFTVSNLTALREVSLRQAAEEVEAQRLAAPMKTTPTGAPADRGEDRVLHTAAPRSIGERLMAIVVPQPSAQRVVRRAWRSAQRLGSELDVLWVAAGEPDEQQAEQQAEQLAALRQLCSVLGAHLLIEHGDDVPHVVARVARERRTTYVLMGIPRPRHAWQRLQRSDLPTRLLELMPGVDVRIVADRSQQDDGAV
jgi:two-component system sensor histidine kinase KdpD